MWVSKSLSIKVGFLFLLSAILIGCGGGGSGGGGSSNGSGGDGGSGNGGSDGGGSTGGGDTGALNSGISGKFFFEDSDNAYLMDIDSGEYTLIPNTDWEDQEDQFPLGIAYYDAKSFASDDAFLLTVAQCKPHGGDSALYQDTCIAIQEFTGNYRANFTVEFDVIGRAKPSYDGQFFALFRDADYEVLEVYDLSGNLISDFGVKAANFEWLPDGRIVFIYEDRSFIITEPYSTDQSGGWTLGDSVDPGVVSNLSVSPDGAKIAFTIINDGTLVSEKATFWMLDVESGSVRRIADAQNGDLEDAFHESAWSPDGTKIAVLEGGATGSDSSNTGVPANMYVLPSDSTEVLVVSQDANLRSPNVVMLKRFLYKDKPPSDNSESDGFPEWKFDWLPE